MKYLEIEYPTINKIYVSALCRYLVGRFNLPHKAKLLDLGCGTGDYVKAFWELGFRAIGVDRPFDFEKDSLSFASNYFDIVFSKSTLEHIFNTQHILSEVYRVLKKDGIAIFLVPDWASQWRYFYDDSTHIKPFTLKGLKQAFLLADFKIVEVSKFLQLPFLWRFPFLKFIPPVVSILPDTTRYWAKVIRFSKERMLLLVARKALI